MKEKYTAIGITEDVLQSEKIKDDVVNFILGEATDIVNRYLPIGCTVSASYYERISKPVGTLPLGVSPSHRIKITLNVNIAQFSLPRERHMQICDELNRTMLFYNNRKANSKIGYKLNYKK